VRDNQESLYKLINNVNERRSKEFMWGKCINELPRDIKSISHPCGINKLKNRYLTMQMYEIHHDIHSKAGKIPSIN
jgi:hypothetical protein